MKFEAFRPFHNMKAKKNSFRRVMRQQNQYITYCKYLSQKTLKGKNEKKLKGNSTKILGFYLKAYRINQNQFHSFQFHQKITLIRIKIDVFDNKLIKTSRQAAVSQLSFYMKKVFYSKSSSDQLERYLQVEETVIGFESFRKHLLFHMRVFLRKGFYKKITI